MSRLTSERRIVENIRRTIFFFLFYNFQFLSLVVKYFNRIYATKTPPESLAFCKTPVKYLVLSLRVSP